MHLPLVDGNGVIVTPQHTDAELANGCALDERLLGLVRIWQKHKFPALPLCAVEWACAMYGVRPVSNLFKTSGTVNGSFTADYNALPGSDRSRGSLILLKDHLSKLTS